MGSRIINLSDRDFNQKGSFGTYLILNIRFWMGLQSRKLFTKISVKKWTHKTIVDMGRVCNNFASCDNEVRNKVHQY